MAMNKAGKAIGLVLGAAILVIFAAAVITGTWSEDLNTDGDREGAPFSPDTPEGGELDDTSINYQMFEVYGPVLIVLALMMFGAIIGGVYIAKEDDEDDSD
ncbi:MAG: hypothetical protein LBE48_01485 [Methanomassiliicoccaceae archaeon]|nr:hypothetical protein [Methanomassiliicoccaceae archaeon]